jgi:hypothetical protein
VITNANSAPAIATANLNGSHLTRKAAAASLAGQGDTLHTDSAAEPALLAVTDSSATQVSDSASQISDLATAAQSVASARQTMLTQPAAALLAQANLSPESVLKLLG